MGSTSGMVQRGVHPQMASARDRCSAAVPNLLSTVEDEKEKMGIAGRMKMEAEFDRQIVVDRYMSEIMTLAE